MARAKNPPPEDGSETGAAMAEGDKPVTRITRKKDLIEAVAAASDVKKKIVKPVVEAVLAELGEALHRGDALVLPPLGKLSVNRSKEGPNGEVIVVKLRRRTGPAGEGGAAGADDMDDGGDGED